MRRGTARSLGHAQLVHQQWLQIVNLRISVYIKRVVTDDNIADLPSRNVCFSRVMVVSLCFALQEFEILKNHGAMEMAPKLGRAYSDVETWAVLAERWRLHVS